MSTARSTTRSTTDRDPRTIFEWGGADPDGAYRLGVDGRPVAVVEWSRDRLWVWTIDAGEQGSAEGCRFQNANEARVACERVLLAFGVEPDDNRSIRYTRPQPETLEEIADEVERARAKFPSTRRMLAALVEEVGELAEAMLELPSSESDDYPSAWRHLRAEASQVAAVAIRIMEEGDESNRTGLPPARFPQWRGRGLVS